jgi:hypothetical protein
MGICGMKRDAKNITIIQATQTHQEPVNVNINNNENLVNKNKSYNDKPEKEFPDFQELNNGKFIGKGVKQIPSYKCLIPYDKLYELREEFWKEKISKNKRWKTIREICESDADSAAQLMEIAGFYCIDNIRVIYEIENPKNSYKIPNYCINDPVFERDYEIYEEKKNTIENIPITIICFISNDIKEITLNAFNKSSGKEIKELISKKIDKPLDKYKFRLFFSGQEISDDHLLYYHNIENKNKIQVNYIEI